MIEFAREEYSEALIEEMRPLWQKHFEEIAAFKHIPLDPDLSVYQACEISGALRIYTARQLQRLVGYEVFFVTRHPHSRQSIQAVQDMLFLGMECRQGLAGYRFIKFCVNELKCEGVQIVHQHISAKNDFGRMFERIGFHLEDLVYSMEIQ